jgi:hypothetical protein
MLRREARSIEDTVMRRPVGMRIYLACVALAVASSAHDTAAQESDFHAIVEPDGKVVLCVTKGEILFADRCAGKGRLTIVQPMKEGQVVWRLATGTVTLNGIQDSGRTWSQAKWDSRTERNASSGKRIELVDPAVVLAQLDSRRPGQFDMKIPGRST